MTSVGVERGVPPIELRAETDVVERDSSPQRGGLS